ncbi:MAG: sugar phosphate isomerase/epimerase [Lachnospiraceae bacterium]|nr:sugar phosphate isomerase/epimerase [Lachnospiraceae bacterium]
MPEIGVQTRNIIDDACPKCGFDELARAGFSCADFSLNTYLVSKELYQGRKDGFFDRPLDELRAFFSPHREAARAAGIRIHQMHMPYPCYIPWGSVSLNEYLWKELSPKCLELCAFFECRYLVVHGFKLADRLGSEAAEWELTEQWLRELAPLARELGIMLCIENLYIDVDGRLVEGPCCDAKKAAERIDRLNEDFHAEVFGFCFDAGHANLVGLDFFSFLTTLGKRIKVLHLHDNDGIADLHQLPFTFSQGNDNLPSADWEGFLRGLRAIGFDGVLNFETGPVLAAFPDVMRSRVLRFIAQIGEYFAGELEGEK